MQMGSEAGGAKRRRVMLLGAGGHASDVLGVIERINLHEPVWDVVGIADDSKQPKLDRYVNRNIRFLGTIDEALARHPDVEFLATVGFPGGRRVVAERAERAGCRAATLVVIGHDTVVGDFSSLMPGAMICGDAVLGADVLVGANATVLQGARIENGASVGAGAVARRVAAGETVSTVWARRRLRAA